MSKEECDNTDVFNELIDIKDGLIDIETGQEKIIILLTQILEKITK